MNTSDSKTLAPDDELSMNRAARYLKVSTTVIRDAANAGELDPFRRIGNNYRFRVSVLDAWNEAHTVGGKA